MAYNELSYPLISSEQRLLALTLAATVTLLGCAKGTDTPLPAPVSEIATAELPGLIHQSPDGSNNSSTHRAFFFGPNPCTARCQTSRGAFDGLLRHQIDSSSNSGLLGLHYFQRFRPDLDRNGNHYGGTTARSKCLCHGAQRRDQRTAFSTRGAFRHCIFSSDATRCHCLGWVDRKFSKLCNFYGSYLF